MYLSMVPDFCKHSQEDTLVTAGRRPAAVPRQKRIRDLFPDPPLSFTIFLTQKISRLPMNLQPVYDLFVLSYFLHYTHHLLFQLRNEAHALNGSFTFEWESQNLLHYSSLCCRNNWLFCTIGSCRQYLSSGLASPSAFLQISTNFTSTLVVPPTSPIL